MTTQQTAPPNARSLLRILRITDEGDEGMQLVIVLPNGDAAWMGCYESDSIAAKILRDLRAFLAAEPQQDNDAGLPARSRIGGHAIEDGPASPISAGEVAALIERLRRFAKIEREVNERPGIAEQYEAAAAMLARLSAERDALLAERADVLNGAGSIVGSLTDAASARIEALEKERDTAYERCAQACDKGARICAELGLSNDMERRNGWLGAAAACRALAAPANEGEG